MSGCASLVVSFGIAMFSAFERSKSATGVA